MRANSRRSRSDGGGRILPNRCLGSRDGGLIRDHTEETERHRTGITELMQFVGRGVAAVARAERHRAVLSEDLALAFEDINLMLPRVEVAVRGMARCYFEVAQRERWCT